MAKPSLKEFAVLANAVYHAGGGEAVELASIGWVVDRAHTNDALGLAMVVYKKEKTRVVAVRGTANGLNVLSDIGLVVGQTPPLCSAVENLVFNWLGNHHWYLTGHSLGAFVAEVVAFKLKIPAVTFESPGSRPWISTLPSFSDEAAKKLITTYVVDRYRSQTGVREHINYINTANQQSGYVFSMCVDVGLAGHISNLLSGFSFFSQSLGAHHSLIKTSRASEKLVLIKATHSQDNILAAIASGAHDLIEKMGRWIHFTPQQALRHFITSMGGVLEASEQELLQKDEMVGSLFSGGVSTSRPSFIFS